MLNLGPRLEAGRRLDIDGLCNARDLGGHHTPDGPTRHRRVVRSEAPTRLTPEGVGQLAEYGITACLDLRSEEEARAEPSPLARWRNYRREPVLNDAALRRVAALRDAADLMDYMLVERAPAIGRGLRTLLELSSGGGVLVHCRAGKDRTGLLAALLLSNAGVDDDAVATDHERSQPNLAPLLEAWAEPIKFAATRESMLATLATFNRRHSTGVRGYLRHAGLAGDEIDALKRLLLYSSDPVRAA